ncbi:MAG TPA: LuxR C-terminal-related transcriptional regulator [Dyella sp.]|uniref:LuxR C-terminal-related transcriptional regulator n=1 Tax=Dyella sp. TaxID=1869338 RepID=UPI002D79CE8E|nr:LuxR C-terminal-related transcriptional regulator [Dyella sp.]HET6555314.1 LuxR C-terminal-related transcriptional regulator [Dyella sp.]
MQDAEFEKSLFQSIALSPIATLVTDPQLPDNPIVCANEAFCRLTGYERHEIVGRNCRFLGGPGTEVSARAQLRKAVAEGTPVLTVLLNYRKDGSPFRNAVMIAPILDAGGKVTYFVGSQMDVTAEATAPAHAQRSAERVAGLTPRQRQVLEWMVKGHRNKQIATTLGIEEKTVKMHRASLLKRLGAATSADAIRIGIEARSLDGTGPS